MDGPFVLLQPLSVSYWDAKTGYAPNWYTFCARYIRERITEDPEAAPTSWAISSLFSPPVGAALEIGCMAGTKLAGLLEAGLVATAHGTDVAAVQIERATRELAPRYDGRLAFFVCDLNTPVLPEAAYDLVLSNGVLHHIERLEACVEALCRALKPGGWLVASEFTGPQRYTYSAEEIAAVNEGIAMLPHELRGPRFHPSQLQPKLDADPSEGVRTDIEPVLRAAFAEVRAIPYGGNVLMRALTPRFFRNFRPENERHRVAVARLVAFDRAISETMPSHHRFFLARA